MRRHPGDSISRDCDSVFHDRARLRHGQKASADTLATELTKQSGRFVEEQTDLKGVFNFVLVWIPIPAKPTTTRTAVIDRRRSKPRKLTGKRPQGWLARPLPNRMNEPYLFPPKKTEQIGSARNILICATIEHVTYTYCRASCASYARV
jgi:hypothetical protein